MASPNKNVVGYMAAFKTMFQPTVDDRYSVAALRQLLRSLPTWRQWSTKRSQQSLVECLRSIAEVVVWGDQHDPAVFAHFCKEDGLQKLIRCARRKSNRRGPVGIQMLQTFAMLVQNIRDKNSMLYILKHEAIRELISLDFDFGDEEVLGYYVSFVKSIAFQLNQSTVASFTRRISPRSKAYTMPLFSEAVRFIDSPERMVRSAARTLTLTIISLKHDIIDEFLISDENRSFFKSRVKNLSVKIHELDRLNEIPEPEKKTLLEIGHTTEEIEDVICYLNDIYTSGSKVVQTELANAVWDEMLGQYLILPLYDAMNKQLSSETPAQAVGAERCLRLRLPKVETLMSIAAKWIPLRQSDFHKTIFTTFVASTMNVLLRGSEFMYSRVIVQLINQAFCELDKSAYDRSTSLVKVDLDTFDLTQSPEWRTEMPRTDTKIDANGCSVGPLGFADYIGLDVCLNVLNALFRQTKCEKYKPCQLMESLAKTSKSKLNGHQFIPFARCRKTEIKSSVSAKLVHRRLGSSPGESALHSQRRTISF